MKKVKFLLFFLLTSCLTPSLISSSDFEHFALKEHYSITGLAAPNLFRNCKNVLDFKLEATLSNLVVESSTAIIEPVVESNNQKIIIPSGTTCTLNCKATRSDGKTVNWTETYTVIAPPRPQISFAANGKITDGLTPISKASRIQLRVIPDSDFAAMMRTDAQYQISTIDVLAHLSLGPATKVNSINTNGKSANKPIAIALGTQIRQVRPGTKVSIRLGDLYRVNSNGKRIKENLSAQEKVFSIIVK